MPVPPGRRDRGYTLVELLVAMGVASVLLVAIGTVFTGVMRGVTTIDVKTTTVADARTSMEAMTRTMRVAFKPASQSAAFSAAGQTDVTFYALLYRSTAGSTASPTAAPDPTLVRYWYSTTDQCLYQTLTPGGTTCLARTAVAPNFSYYQTGTSSTALADASGQVPPANLPLIRSIAITVTVQDPNQPTVTGIPLIDRVTLTNIAV